MTFVVSGIYADINKNEYEQSYLMRRICASCGEIYGDHYQELCKEEFEIK